MDTKKEKFSIKHTILITLAVILFCGGLTVFGYNYALKAAINNSVEEARANAKESAAQAKDIDIAEELRQKTIKDVKENGKIKSYSYAEVCSMDMSIPSGVSVADLKLVTRYNLVGLEEKLYQMDNDYNLNCLLLLGIASHESAYGTMQFHPNNLCGYGYSGFSSKEECLDTVGRVLAKSYLDPSGSFYKGKTIDSVNKTYAADPAWDSKVARKVASFYQTIAAERNKRIDELK